MRTVSRYRGVSSIDLTSKKLRGVLEFIIFVVPGLGFYIIFLIIPLLVGIYYSFTNFNPLYPNTSFISFENYQDLWDDRFFKATIEITVKIGLIVTISSNLFGLLVALMLNRVGVFYNVLRTMFFIPQVLSAVIVSFIWKILFRYDGIFNALLADLNLIEKPISWLGPDYALYSIAFVVTWQMTGFSAVIYLASLQRIPAELYEAAVIDGANVWHKFRHVTFPLIAPGVTINLVLAMIITFKLYDHIVVLTGGGPARLTETMSITIVKTGFTSNQMGYASAMGVVLFLFIGVVSIFQVTLLRRREVDL